MAEFGTLNWSILIVYIVGNLLLGYYLSKRISTADHFFLGDRSTPWWAIGISVVATYVSALSFLGGPSWAYADGFSVIALHANYPIVIFVVITLFLPFFYNSGVASISAPVSVPRSDRMNHDRRSGWNGRNMPRSFDFAERLPRATSEILPYSRLITSSNWLVSRNGL